MKKTIILTTIFLLIIGMVNAISTVNHPVDQQYFDNPSVISFNYTCELTSGVDTCDLEVWYQEGAHGVQQTSNGTYIENLTFPDQFSLGSTANHTLTVIVKNSSGVELDNNTFYIYYDLCEGTDGGYKDVNYTMTQDLVCGGGVTINGTNTVFDGAGYTLDSGSGITVAANNVLTSIIANNSGMVSIGANSTLQHSTLSTDVNLEGDNAKIDNSTITNGVTSDGGADGYDGLQIINSVISNNGDAISMSGTGDIFDNLLIHNNVLNSSTTYGLDLEGVTNSNITNNEFNVNSANAIQVDSAASNVRIESNAINNAANALNFASTATTITFKDNNVTTASNGLVFASGVTTLEGDNNNFQSITTSAYAINVANSTDIYLHDENFQDSTNYLYGDDATTITNVLIENFVSDNSNGKLVRTVADKYHNNITIRNAAITNHQGINLMDVRGSNRLSDSFNNEYLFENIEFDGGYFSTNYARGIILRNVTCNNQVAANTDIGFQGSADVTIDNIYNNCSESVGDSLWILPYPSSATVDNYTIKNSDFKSTGKIIRVYDDSCFGGGLCGNVTGFNFINNTVEDEVEIQGNTQTTTAYNNTIKNKFNDQATGTKMCNYNTLIGNTYSGSGYYDGKSLSTCAATTEFTGGSTTNFSSITDYGNVTFTLERGDNKVTYSNINLSNTTGDFDSAFNLGTTNRMELEPSLYTVLNTTTTIAFASLSAPTINEISLRKDDDSEIPVGITGQAYASNIYSFTTTAGWSSYSIEVSLASGSGGSSSSAPSCPNKEYYNWNTEQCESLESTSMPDQTIPPTEMVEITTKRTGLLGFWDNFKNSFTGGTIAVTDLTGNVVQEVSLKEPIDWKTSLIAIAIVIGSILIITIGSKKFAFLTWFTTPIGMFVGIVLLALIVWAVKNLL